MKKIFTILLTTCMFIACGGDSTTDDPDNPNPNPKPNPDPDVTTYSVNGSVQKGPFTQGTSITIQALDEALNPTGKNYQTKTTDDAGTFKINNQIESRYVEIIATGYYFNEISGQVSNSPITLRSLSDLTETGKTNVNLLTTLESDRIRKLVVQNASTVQAAREQAEKELFGIFHIPNAVSATSGFDKMDITQGGESNAILLAISATLQGNRTEGVLSELISKIASEIEASGTIENEIITEQIREGGMTVNAESVRANLVARYKALGVSGYEIPPFEDYLDINGNGVIDKKDNWLILSEKEFHLSDEGGTIEVELQHNIDYDVTIEDDGGDWINNITTRAFMETDKLTFTVKKNETYDARYARIAIKDRASSYTEYITISQKQLDALTVSSNRYEVDKNGGTIDVEVKANISFSVEIPSEYRNWITQAPSTRALTSTALQFNIAKSNEADVREGKIIIKNGSLSETITIYQTGEKVLVLNQKEYTVSDKGATIDVEVTSNIDYEVVMPSANWITETQKTRGIITNTRSFIISSNPTYDARDVEIIFRDKNSSLQEKVIVYQTQKDAIIVARKSYNFDNTGGKLELELQTNIDVEVEIPESSQAWISQAPKTRALVDQTLNFNIAANNAYDKREGEIIVKNAQSDISEIIKVYQTQKNAIILTQNEYTLTDKEDSFSIEVKANVDFSVNIEGGSSWLHQITTRSMISHTLNFKVDANTTYDSRDAVITITNTANNLKEIVKVHQSQKDAIIIGTDKYEVPYTGGNVNIEVKSNIDYEVTITEGTSWITRAPETRSLTESTVPLKIAKNENITDRIGKVEIRDIEKGITNTVTITQAGNADAQTIHVDEAGTLGSILSDIQKANLANIKITGNINKDDFKTIESMPRLTDLDLSEVIVEANIIPNEALSEPNGFGGITWWESQSNLVSIILPEGIISIGEHAFEGCKSLQNINIPTTVKQINEGAFGKTALREIDIPAGILIIAKETFADCTTLETVNFAPDAKLLRIESSASGDPLGNTSSNGAFRGCTSLSKFELPASVTHLGVGTFKNCSALEELLIPDNTALTAIEGYYYKDDHVIGSKPVTGGLIEGCSALKILRIPAKITRLDKYAFAGSGLEQVIFGENSQCTQIGNQVFASCWDLRDITIPTTVKTLGDQVFLNCTSLTSLDLSKVETLGTSVFGGCSSLKEIILPQNMTEISANFFAGCIALEECRISDNVEKIGEGAFNGCAKLLEIPTSAALKKIGREAFKGCARLKSVSIPKTVVFIDQRAFEDCISLTDFILSHNDSIAINDQVFYNCTALKNIKLTARKISTGAVFEGTRISRFEMPAEVEYWGNPTKVTHGDVINTYSFDFGLRFSPFGPFKGSQISVITFEAGSQLKECGTWAFAGAENLSSLTLPSSVEVIGGELFAGNKSMLEFNIPAHIKRITGPVYGGSSILYPTVENSSNLEYLEMYSLINVKNTSLDLSNCTYIGTCALAGCPELTSVTLCQSGRLVMNDNIFYSSPNLKEIIIPQGLTELVGEYYGDGKETTTHPLLYSSVERVYCEPESQLSHINIDFSTSTWEQSGKLRTIDLSNITAQKVEIESTNGAFSRCPELSELKLPRCKELSLYGTESFLEETPKLTKLEIPGTIQSITTQGGIFAKSSITEVTSEANGVELTIPSNFFGNAIMLTSVNLPNVRIIKHNTFSNCRNLNELIIGTGDMVIEDFAFQNCGLKVLTIPDNATSLTFQRSVNDYSPLSKSSIETLKTSANAKLKSIKSSGITRNSNNPLRSIDLPTVTYIGDGFFIGCENLTDVSLPVVEFIGKSVFEGCKNLTSITLPNVTTIGTSAFKDCTNLSSIAMSSVTTIGTSAFENCTGLTSITLPNITTIASSTFSNCTSLESVSFPKVITVNGFNNCTNLTTVSIPTAETIETNAFSNCTKLKQITLPNVKSIKEKGFAKCTSLLSISFPSLEELRREALSDCPLTRVDFPTSFKTIGHSCLPASVKTVICRATTIPSAIPLEKPFILMDLPNSTLKVPFNSLEKYKEPGSPLLKNHWSDFGTIVAIE